MVLIRTGFFQGVMDRSAVPISIDNHLMEIARADILLNQMIIIIAMVIITILMINQTTVSPVFVPKVMKIALAD